MGKHDNQRKLRLIHDVGFDRFFSASTWAEYNRKFFDQLAGKYDAANQLHSFGTKHKIDRAAVARLPVAPGARVLDLCAGSGDISIEIARRHSDVTVTALDASAAMLHEAERKARELNGITFILGDALDLPFENDTFDGAVISFGLRNLEDLEAGLREMLRVVKPGGFVSNIDQGKPTNPLFRVVYQAYFYHVAPLIGKVVFHRGEFNSFRYLPESNRYFPDQRALVEIFENLGLREVCNYNYWVGAVAQQVGLVPHATGNGK